MSSGAPMLAFTVRCPGLRLWPATRSCFNGYVNGNAQSLQEAEQYALNAGWQRRSSDGALICPSCVAIVTAQAATIGQVAVWGYPLVPPPGMPTPSSSAADPASTRPLSVPKLRASDLLTYCDHCGYSLVGEYDDHSNTTILRCPTTNAVWQVVPAEDTAEWPEWALEQLYRMCKNR